MKTKLYAVAIIAALIALCIHIGARLESMKIHRRECVLSGGYPEGLMLDGCFYDGAFDRATLERLNRSCPDGRGWYIYNDANTYWRHKCN